MFANEGHAGYREFAAQVAGAFQDVLGIDARRVYICFTDPMVGLSWEFEPTLRKLEVQFAGRLHVEYAMGVLAPSIEPFMTGEERALPPAERFERYNRRLAGIYREEEPIAGMPINMEGFRLFSPERRSTLPLNLAFEAARVLDEGRAARFLYRLRYATVVECRPTTCEDEILRVAELAGYDGTRFCAEFRGPQARALLDADLDLKSRAGVRGLPAFLVSCGDRAYVLHGLAGFRAFTTTITRLTDGRVRPKPVRATVDAVRHLLAAHPLISPIEVQAAFDLAGQPGVRALLEPLEASGEIRYVDVPGGWFIQSRGLPVGG